MPELPQLALMALAAALAAGLGSVAGSGGTAVLLPVLVLFLGIREAVPVLTIANLAANLSRVWFNREALVFPVVGWFSLGALPLTVAGALLFSVTAPDLLTRGLGAFLIATVVWQRLRPRPVRGFNVRWFGPLGALFGFLAGLIEGVGPLMAPFFLAFGLIKGSYIATDALCTVGMQATKLIVFGNTALLEGIVPLLGLGLAPFMVLGTWTGKRLLDRLPEHIFRMLIQATLLIAGVGFLVGK